MDKGWLERTREMRAEAWEAVVSSADYAAFKTFDDAVVSLGGSPMFNLDNSSLSSTTKRVVEAATRRIADGKKLSQGDAAEMVLRVSRMPLSIAPLMEAVLEKGAEIGGTDPLNNFRSTISKDERFYSVKHGNFYYWWLKDLPLPPRGNETAGPDLLTQPAVSSKLTNQEGGGGHAPTTT